MLNTQRKPPPGMTVADFIDRRGDGTGRRFQPVDAEVRALPPGSLARALIHTDLICLVANHLEAIGSRLHALSRPPAYALARLARKNPS